MKKKIFGYLVMAGLLSVLLSIFTITASAATGSKLGENVYWSLDDDGLMTIYGEGEMYHYDDFDYMMWWRNEVSPAQIEVKTILIKGGVTSVGVCAFESTSVRNVIMEEGVLSIGVGAFRACPYLKSIIIPSSVEKISNQAFLQVGEVFPDLIYMGTKEQWAEIDGSDYLHHYHEIVFLDAKGTCGDNLEWTLDKYGELIIKGIGSMDEQSTAWDEHKDKIKKVVIKDGITDISANRFANYINLREISVPDGFIDVGDGAFAGCTNLTSIKLPVGVKRIGNNAFSGCENLNKITLNAGLDSIGEGAFYNCPKLSNVDFYGTARQWNNINKGSNNGCLLNATLDCISKEIEIYQAGNDVVDGAGLIKVTAKVKLYGDVKVDKFGTIFIPREFYNNANMNTATVVYDNAKHKIKNGQIFGATITDIPEGCWDMDIVARSFIIDSDGECRWSEAKYLSVNNRELIELD